MFNFIVLYRNVNTMRLWNCLFEQVALVSVISLNFNSHMKAITKSAFYHLKNIAKLRGFMSKDDLEKRIHAFISRRVDYCNGLFTGLHKKP